MSALPQCQDCTYFCPKGDPTCLHDECHAPVPVWVQADTNHRPGSVEANYPAQNCQTFVAARAPSGAAASTGPKRGTA